MYTTKLPIKLAQNLCDKGMGKAYYFYRPWLKPTIATYAEVFDWLPSRGIFININPAWNTEGGIKGWVYKVYRVGRPPYPYTGFYEIWEEAANNAIVKAIELL